MGLKPKIHDFLSVFFRIGYLSVDESGYLGNDRYNLIEEFA